MTTREHALDLERRAETAHENGEFAKYERLRDEADEAWITHRSVKDSAEDMLAALERIAGKGPHGFREVCHGDCDKECAAIARAAIRKAKGS